MTELIVKTFEIGEALFKFAIAELLKLGAELSAFQWMMLIAFFVVVFYSGGGIRQYREIMRK